MNSGISPTEEHVEEFNLLKMKGLNKILIFSLNAEMNKLELLFKADKAFQYDDLKAMLPNDDCRFVVYDFDYETLESPPRKTSKLILIYWAPIAAPMKRKFTFSSTKGALKSAFIGIQKDLQPSDWSDLEREHLTKEIRK